MAARRSMRVGCVLAMALGLAGPARAADTTREEPHITATIDWSEATGSPTFRQVHGSGYGFSGGLEVPFKPMLAFHGWLGLDHFPLDEEATKQLVQQQVGNAPESIDGGGVNVITIVCGPRFQWQARPTLRPYVQGTIGVSYSGVDDLLIDGQPYLVNVEGTSSGQITYGFEVGLRFGARGHFGWTVSGGWMSTRLSGDMLAWAPIRIGLITP